MKKTFFRFGFTVFTAVLFLITACGGGAGGGGGIPVKIRAYDNHGNPQNRSIYRAVGGGLARAPRAVDSSFDTYASFYGKLKAKKGAGITPTKFVLNSAQIGLISAGWEGDINLAEGGKDFDFAQGQTFDVGDVPADTICSAIMFRFMFREVEFAWPNDLVNEDITAYLGGHYNHPGPHGESTSMNGNKLTMYGGWLTPAAINNNYTLYGDNPSGIEVGDVMHILYGGSGNIRLNYESSLWADEVVPGFPHRDISAGGGQQGNTAADIVVPFEPINVPAGSSSVTFNMSWNLDGMIERYEGKTSASDDDIFILKNGWWEGLHISASVP